LKKEQQQSLNRQLAAVETERREVAHRAQVASDAADALAADREHRGNVHRKCLADFIAKGVPVEHATLMIKLIAGSNHPHLKIQY